MHKTIICDYCLQPAVRVTGRELHPKKTELAHRFYYMCKPCGAWVGCHKGTDVPFGRLADARLRYWRVEAHAAFDPIWGKKAKGPKDQGCCGRTPAYRWLAGKLGVHPDKCHIGLFDEELCQRTIDACAEFRIWIDDQRDRRERVKRMCMRDGRRRA